MKKIILLQFILLATVVCNAQIQTLYGGLNVGQTATSDFGNFDLSDWEKYGLFSVNPASEEGRATVDLSNVIPNSQNYGGVLGARYPLSEKVSIIGEIQFAVSNISMLGLMVGVNYEFLQTKKFSLGITPKIGYSLGSIDLGVVAPVDGFTNSVDLAEGEFEPGNAISMSFQGFSAGLGITPTIKITDRFSLTGFVGYNLSLVQSLGLTINNVDLEMTNAALVKSDGSNTPCGLDPQLTTTGVNFQIGFSYRIW